jgi:hypothetical protein
MRIDLIKFMHDHNYDEMFGKILIVIGLFLAPIGEVMIAMYVLLGIDFVVGVWASLKLDPKSFSARRMRGTIDKGLIYSLCIIASHIVQTEFIPIVPLVRIFVGFIGLTELRSIYENASKITGLKILEHMKGFLKKK